MSKVTIWTLESDYDKDAVKVLVYKLVENLTLQVTSVRAVGKQAVPKRRRSHTLADALKKAVRNYLKEDNCVIFIIDSDGPIASFARRQEANSLVNQVKTVVSDSEFTDRVHLAWAKQELEAWLLIDCIGVFCYFASQRSAFRTNCRTKATSNPSFLRLIKKYQKGDTELIVEAERGGKGVKEYLVDFSQEILVALNPQMPNKNLKQEKYHERISPEIAQHVEINSNTLRRNASLNHLGALLSECS